MPPTLEAFLNALNGEPSAYHYWYDDLVHVLRSIAAGGDASSFRRVMEDYQAFTVRYWQAYNWGNPAMARAGALENLATAAAAADYPGEDISTSPRLRHYYRSGQPGEAMRLFLEQTGYTGEQVAFLMESTADPDEEQKAN